VGNLIPEFFSSSDKLIVRVKLILISMFFISASARAEPEFFQGIDAGKVYEVLQVREQNVSHPLDSVSYKSVGGLSCRASCAYGTLGCEYRCSLKQASTGHAELWNALRLPIQRRRASDAVFEEYCKVLGPLECLAKIGPSGADFKCVVVSASPTKSP
jgi:hypothetical protein